MGGRCSTARGAAALKGMEASLEEVCERVEMEYGAWGDIAVHCVRRVRDIAEETSKKAHVSHAKISAQTKEQLDVYNARLRRLYGRVFVKHDADKDGLLTLEEVTALTEEGLKELAECLPPLLKAAEPAVVGMVRKELEQVTHDYAVIGSLLAAARENVDASIERRVAALAAAREASGMQSSNVFTALKKRDGGVSKENFQDNYHEQMMKEHLDPDTLLDDLSRYKADGPPPERVPGQEGEAAPE